MIYYLSWVFALLFALLAFSLICGMIRLLRGPTLADRVVALDYMVVVGVAILGLYGRAYGSVAYLDVAGTLALIGFVSSVAFARYLERRATS